MTVSKGFLVFVDLTVLGSTGQVYVGPASNGDLMFFWTGVMNIWEEVTEIRCYFLHIMSRVYTSNMIYDLMLTWITLLKWCLLGFSTIKILFFPFFPYFTHWKEVTICFPYLRSIQLCAPSFMMK